MNYEEFVEVWLKDRIQIAALCFMTLMYALKIWGIMKRPPILDRTPKRGDPNAGMRYSLLLVAMPWEMNSYRSHPAKYVEFVCFHLGIAAAILATFLIPYLPDLMLLGVIRVPCMILLALGLACGAMRFLRRILSVPLRAVSNVDDYFSILLLNAYLLTAFLAIPKTATHDWQIVLFFSLTTFFLVYVPFSKISHYVLWPFSRYYIGKHFGKRGVYPKQPGSIRPTSV